MARFIWIMAVFPMMALADHGEGGVALTGPQIESVLTDRALIYTDGATQTFGASGATMYDAGRASWGRWAVRGDQYCSQWPPNDSWACYDMEKQGPVIRFIAEDGSMSEGVYLDN